MYADQWWQVETELKTILFRLFVEIFTMEVDQYGGAKGAHTQQLCGILEIEC